MKRVYEEYPIFVDNYEIVELIILKDFVWWQQSLVKKKGMRQAHQHASQVYQIWKRVDAHLSLTSILDASLIREMASSSPKGEGPGHFAVLSRYSYYFTSKICVFLSVFLNLSK